MKRYDTTPREIPQIATLETHRRLQKRSKKTFGEAVQPFMSKRAEFDLLALLCQQGQEALYRSMDRGVDIACFYADLHAEIYSAVCLAIDRHESIDATLLHSALTQVGCGEADVRGLGEAIPELFYAPPTSDIDTLCAELVDIRDRRNAQIAGIKIAHGASRLDRGAIASELSTIATRIHAGGDADDTLSVGGAGFLDYLNRKAARMKAGEKPCFIDTGIPLLDRLLGGGFESGQTYQIVAPPKVGKSQLASAIKSHVLRTQPAVFVDDYTVEMTCDEIYDLILASGMTQIAVLEGQRPSFVPTTAEIRRGHAHNLERLKDSLRTYGASMAGFMDRHRVKFLSGETVEWVEQHVRMGAAKWRAEHGEDAPYLVVVDYGQDLTTEHHTKNDTERYAYVAKKLRQIAKKYHVTVVTVLHSGGAQDIKRDPGEHIHGSSQWTKDTSGLIILWRPFHHADDAKDNTWKWMQVLVDKVRWGGGGRGALCADVSRAYFEDWQGPVPQKVDDLLKQQAAGQEQGRGRKR